nr:protease do-like 7 [Quercus suber]
MGDPMERLGSESDSSIKVDSDLSMEIDPPPPPLCENVATAEDWRRALDRVVPVVVVLRTNACRAFDTEFAGASYATGFVGPVVAEAMFV